MPDILTLRLHPPIAIPTIPALQGPQNVVHVQASPLDPECEQEGKIVCSQGHIKGRPGT